MAGVTKMAKTGRMGTANNKYLGLKELERLVLLLRPLIKPSISCSSVIMVFGYWVRVYERDFKGTVRHNWLVFYT